MTAAALILVWLLGMLLGALIPPVTRFLKHWGKSKLTIINWKAGTITEAWRRIDGRYPLLKIDGKKASPAFKGKGNFRYGFGNTSAFLIDAVTGHPLRYNGDKFQGISAYDSAVALSDNRSRNVATSTDADGLQWAKIGAIVGIILGILVLGVLVLVYQLWDQADQATHAFP